MLCNRLILACVSCFLGAAPTMAKETKTFSIHQCDQGLFGIWPECASHPEMRALYAQWDKWWLGDRSFTVWRGGPHWQHRHASRRRWR